MQPSFQRQVTLLSLIPRAPRKISVNELVERLTNRTQDVSKRAVQRDLKAMYEMGTFGLHLDDRSKHYGWSIESCCRGLNLDLMDQHMACSDDLEAQREPAYATAELATIAALFRTS